MLNLFLKIDNFLKFLLNITKLRKFETLKKMYFAPLKFNHRVKEVLSSTPHPHDWLRH